MKKTLPEKCEKILKGRALRLAREADSDEKPKKQKKRLAALKLVLIFAAAGLFFFFLTLADYRSGSLSAYGGGGLFSVKEFGGSLFITLFGSETSFPLPKIIIELKDAVAAFFSSF